MTIEQSHGKARTVLPRSSDLATVPHAEPEPNRQRSPDGRFAGGNGLALGRGAKAAVRRLLGRGAHVGDEAAASLARDAERLFSATLRELPSDGSTVRQLTGLFARHTALAGFWSAKASAAGLASPEGIEAADQATKHGVRAERLAVTMLDVSTRLAAARPPVDPLAALRARLGGPQ